MTADYTAQVDDLVLFFRDDDGSLGIRLVPRDIYSEPQLALTDLAVVAPDHQGSVIVERKTTGGTYYVANLSCLLDPGTSPYRGETPEVAVREVDSTSSVSPSNGDLVVVPYNNPNKGFLVSRSVYKRCQPLTNTDIPDIVTMALDEGVVLANIPKATPSGITCYLLSLVSLRSGALEPEQRKTEAAMALAHAARKAAVRVPKRS
jgi:hypothetical protein